MVKRQEPSFAEIHKFVPEPHGNYLGQYLCRRPVRGSQLVTTEGKLVTCSRCLGIMAMLQAEAA